MSTYSAVLQIIRVLNYWNTNNDDDAINVIYCDFMTVFYRVPHNRPIKKRKSYVVRVMF